MNVLLCLNLKKLSKVVGYSGHYTGIDDAISAICQGASYVEKHFTVDKELPGRDNKFALNPEKFKELRKWANLSNLFLKDQGLDLQDCEKDIFQNYRGRWDNKNVK